MPSDYTKDWQDAKDKFETDTGLKKPAAKGKALFVTWRKPSGIEETLKTIDKLIDSARDLDAVDAKFYKKWEEALAAMNKKRIAHLKTLQAAVDDEKEAEGKSDRYRSLKVLKASLDAIAARAEQKYKDHYDRWQMLQGKAEKMLDTVEAVIHMLKHQGANIKSAAAKATLWCKEVLADPTPATYNSGRLDAARNLRQCIGNLNRYVYTDYVDLLVKNKTAELRIVEDERMIGHIRKMSVVLANLQADITAMATKSGNTPTNGSLEFLGTETEQIMPADATPNDVKAGIKHFAEMVKQCSEISAHLVRFGL